MFHGVDRGLGPGHQRQAVLGKLTILIAAAVRAKAAEAVEAVG